MVMNLYSLYFICIYETISTTHLCNILAVNTLVNYIQSCMICLQLSRKRCALCSAIN